ncbi:MULTISPECIES: dTDP-glucose 4,6-dehydratase [Methylobacterium]|uniref:dTDP-glucose 4,6-dehydratase n=2 Tax=Pseudomonadota TaxID=1224 RepID=A0ABQ4ST00_9HYPH|nr:MULTISPECIES: dTDP-glucose 4,6-dehydratase [Methylobacterium]PIU06440.1 MAG: dTDP-glucose 4,6-dehydratase [Methylobacterium sp. CG09_land_8_20_14_0_10_71_15]PIU14306.1 MAG: dTDP-glucose 4,6-dehydratase [Methylobacterium sp. CG08_land_8_20_14_0_20_71_15]GBU16685.1 dTDP-glucose 4,6-dehydratase [Methylobacterium sp.]GJE05416.1 dTDP-glucose 4,6-dehydratase 2 [Methylobacterium jeotgali]
MRIIVTGGCGFIGSALVLHLVEDLGHEVTTLDALTYAANPISLRPLEGNPRHRFVQADICDAQAVEEAFAAARPQAVMHLAAESHVDRSITGPGAFIRTNVVGTQVMLEAARRHWSSLEGAEREAFRFLHVSTDEVYGSLPPGGFFTEASRYDPRSPYSASKAGSDHLARAWHETYGLPVLVTNCSNNYGPRHFPEKLIPLMILNALEGKPLPVYGDGLNERDWIHVEDHASGLVAVLERGRVGETYLLGGRSVRNNLAVVKALCAAFDRLRPEHAPHERLITFVADRPGHDRRYAIDPSKAEAEVGYRPSRSFEQALEDTVRWYLDNESWWRPIREGRYSGERLGLGSAKAG